MLQMERLKCFPGHSLLLVQHCSLQYIFLCFVQHNHFSVVRTIEPDRRIQLHFAILSEFKNNYKLILTSYYLASNYMGSPAWKLLIVKVWTIPYARCPYFTVSRKHYSRIWNDSEKQCLSDCPSVCLSLPSHSLSSLNILDILDRTSFGAMLCASYMPKTMGLWFHGLCLSLNRAGEVIMLNSILFPKRAAAYLGSYIPFVWQTRMDYSRWPIIPLKISRSRNMLPNGTYP